MTSDSDTSSPKLYEVPPAETAGRSTIGRYQAQFRAAAFECLSILSGTTIDRVYCDYHDDFVTRTANSGQPLYHFFQVKTHGKRNHLWSKLDLFGLYKQKNKSQNPEKISKSFAGKLILHTTRFNNSCGNVVFLTNVQFDDTVEEIVSSLLNGDFSNNDIRALIENFNEAFVEGEPINSDSIKKHIEKLQLKPGIPYLDPFDDTFAVLARSAIYKYSEIDLQHVEGEEIIRSLVNLVEQKSFTKMISDMDETEFDDTVGVGISDMLEILSISKGAYQQLLNGGDSEAIKNASIIQRKLSQANATEDTIEYCSRAKVNWDIWFRDKRHTLPEFDLHFLLDKLNAIKNDWISGGNSFADLKSKITVLWEETDARNLNGTLTKDLILGGIFSALVRSESQ